MVESFKIVLGVAILVLVVAAYVIVPRRVWTTKAASLPSLESAFAGLGSASWTWHFLFGGASWPLVRVRFNEWGIQIAPSGWWVGWYVPRVTLRWTDVDYIRQVGNHGVVLGVRDRPKATLRVNLANGSLPSRLRTLGILS